MTESVRLSKRVAELFACSRSEAEQYIEGGWVTVDGVVVEEPGFRVAQQTIALLPDASPTPPEPVTFLFHKPAGMDTLAIDPAQLLTPALRDAGDRSGVRLLKRHVASLTLTDALETEASGLLVFTQDWRIKRKLVDDAAKVEHEFIVDVTGELAPYGLALLNHGLSWNGKPLPPIKVSWQSEHRLRFALKSPPRGLISHMCAKVGLQVTAMKRLRIGRVPMAGLPQGRWRFLHDHERF
ncbi:MAG TPA: rRNA pseudouridine synthase [Noviherbaspirillum sp.]|uniref:rRNA pseudouridine synthase n=1 Tax=Noviherbaspirillum sp. TaxID=1926288 RepID=UPI002DDD4455|nr:rRNA pseudouridine synthase [Noviherbaspirillum sp.]HEV2611031.1 rRNA pseudouridine synthase [Noviherbaspirillum sp.]